MKYNQQAQFMVIESIKINVVNVVMILTDGDLMTFHRVCI